MELLDETRFIENQKELVALQRLDDKCTQLKQEGKYAEALECMEKGWRSASISLGPTARKCGLPQEEFPVVLELLKKAETLTEKHQAGHAAALNNFACYYRWQGNLHKSLTYLTEAIKIETKLNNIPNKADTHSNMCAVLSQLGKHQSALGHAQSVLILLHEELQLGRSGNNGSSPPKHNNNNSHHHHGLHGNSGAELDPSKFDRVAVLGTAYRNVDIEHEFLKCYDQSLQLYKKGVDIASRFLGDAHGIVITLQNSLLTAKRYIAAKSRMDRRAGDGISDSRTPRSPTVSPCSSPLSSPRLGRKKAEQPWQEVVAVAVATTNLPSRVCAAKTVE